MFFIPFFRKVDWSNPPLITILLIMLNCLIFIIFQGRDDQYTEQAYEFYLQSELPDIEIPLYFDYLQKNNRFQKIEDYQAYLDQGGEYRLAVAAPMQQDTGFMRLLENGSLFADTAGFTRWKNLHEQFQTKLQQATWYSYGLKPNQPTAVTFVTNMFLHGSWGHLIGNMVFLFIIGFVVEYALGRTSYLMGYLLAGLFGGVLYVLFNSASQTATVGASGAIAGLMGMYTLLFGLRKINFFYFVFVYFDYIKAPAIVLFPIWLGHEIVQLLMQSEQGINYYAHIGGLCSGALYAFIAKRHLGVNLDYLDQNDKEEAEKQRVEQGMNLLAQMKPQEAAAIFRSLAAEYPNNRDYLLQWYNAAKRLPSSDDFHAAANRMLMLADKDQPTYQLIRTTYNDYMKLAQPKPSLNSALLVNVTTALSLGGFFEDAEKSLILLKRSKLKEQVAEATLILANAFHKANNRSKYQHYLELIAQDFAQTPTANEASRRLQWLNSG
jgi:membrane associated rhomboid family serine protease